MADTAFPYDRDRTPRDQPRSLLRVQLSGFTAVMTLSVPEISCLTEELQYRCSVVQTICDITHANRSPDDARFPGQADCRGARRRLRGHPGGPAARRPGRRGAGGAQ